MLISEFVFVRWVFCFLVSISSLDFQSLLLISLACAAGVFTGNMLVLEAGIVG